MVKNAPAGDSPLKKTCIEPVEIRPIVRLWRTKKTPQARPSGLKKTPRPNFVGDKKTPKKNTPHLCGVVMGFVFLFFGYVRVNLRAVKGGVSKKTAYVFNAHSVL